MLVIPGIVKLLLMPVVLITIIYLLLYRTMWFKKNVKRKNPKLYFGLHVFLCAASLVLMLMHVYTKLPFFAMISIWMKLTGVLMLVLFIIQAVIGIKIKTKPNKNLFKLHRQIPAVLLALFVFHAFIFKMMFF